MHLGDRLASIASHIKKGSKIADVGTDHAYLPIFLVQEKIIDFAVATDIVVGPCEAAEKSVAKYSLQKNISVRQGDGLQSVLAGEVDTVTIAGMGGTTIVNILEKAYEVLIEVKCLILQPMGESMVLRQWLYENNWMLSEEDLVMENDRLYEILVAKKSSNCLVETPSDLELLIGPILLKEKPKLFKKHIENTVNKYKNICNSMEKSTQAILSEKYLQNKKILTSLEKILKCL